MKRERLPFRCALSRTEGLLGLGFLPLPVFALPILLGMLVAYWPTQLSGAKANTLYYLIGFLFLMSFLRGGLRRDWDLLFDNGPSVLFSLVLTHALNVILSLVIALVSIALLEDGVDPYAVETAPATGGSMFAVLVFLAPIVEETLFRGVLFGRLREKSRIAAYLVSVLAFSAAGAWESVVAGADALLLFQALQYIPIGLALAWCYERTGCLWAPILYQALSNLGPALLL